jgi:predicted lipopolysaccharide heptosyltransferase III
VNILLIQLKRIGDLILTVPAIAAIQKHFPDAELSLVVAHGSRELLPAIPGIKRGFVAKGNFRDAAGWLALAGGRKYRYCLDFTGNDRSALVTFLSRARKRIAYQRVQRSALRALTYNEFVKCRMRSVHTIDFHLALLKPLGINAASPAIELSLPPNSRAEADRLLLQKQVTRDFVVFHCGSARAEKFWVAQRWAEAIDHCATQLQLDCVLTAGSSAIEQQHLGEIKSHTRQRVIDLSGHMDLLALTALLARARMLVTIDSAPVHLAAAMRTPQVALFGPTNPFHWRPLSSPAVIVHAGAPEPLTGFSPDQPRVPMNQISTQQVIGAMESLLSAPAAPSS